MIKLHFKGLKALNFKKVLNRKAGIIGAAALIITATLISLSLTRQTSSAPQAKGVSTTVSDNKSSDQTGTDTNAPVTTESATPSSPSASASPASQPASNTKKPTTPQTKNPTSPNPNPAPSTPQNPSPAPSPTPQPTYRVTLHPDQARAVHYSFGKQLQVPFTVTYDPGFVKADYRQPGCSFLVAPSPSHGMLCDVSQKEADTGFLVMQYNDATVKGYYKVQMSYPIGNTVRTDSFEFNFDFN
jgi:hypothetical protein